GPCICARRSRTCANEGGTGRQSKGRQNAWGQRSCSRCRAVSLPLRPTDLLIFGNAKGGTPLMQAAQAIGIDLPLKALVWKDGSATTWLSYNDQRGNDRERGRNHEGPVSQPR